MPLLVFVCWQAPELGLSQFGADHALAARREGVDRHQDITLTNSEKPAKPDNRLRSAKRLLDDVAGQSQYVRDIVDFVLGESDRSFLTPG